MQLTLQVLSSLWLEVISWGYRTNCMGSLKGDSGLKKWEVWMTSNVTAKVKILFWPGWTLFYLAPGWRESTSTCPLTHGLFCYLLREQVKFILSSLSILDLHSCWVGNSDPAGEEEGTQLSVTHHPLVLLRSLPPCKLALTFKGKQTHPLSCPGCNASWVGREGAKT
jgi:hypothetical protein